MRSALAIALALLLAVAMLAPAAAGPDPDAPASRLQDRWIVISDHYPAGPDHPRAPVEHQVEGVIVEWTEIRPSVFEATVVDGGYVDCFAPGTVVITEMVERSNGSSTFDGLVLDADCTLHRVELEMTDADTAPFLVWDTPTGRMRMDLGTNDWVEVEHRVIGDWLLAGTDDPDGPAGRTVLRITGSSPTFTATIVEAEEGSCFVPGEVWWDGLTWGHGLIQTGTDANRAWGMADGFRIGRYDDCGLHTGGGSVSLPRHLARDEQSRARHVALDQSTARHLVAGRGRLVHRHAHAQADEPRARVYPADGQERGRRRDSGDALGQLRLAVLGEVRDGRRHGEGGRQVHGGVGPGALRRPRDSEEDRRADRRQ